MSLKVNIAQAAILDLKELMPVIEESIFDPQECFVCKEGELLVLLTGSGRRTVLGNYREFEPTTSVIGFRNAFTPIAVDYFRRHKRIAYDSLPPPNDSPILGMF